MFRDEAAKHIESDWRITEDLDRTFRDEFQGVFLSPLSNETVETRFDIEDVARGASTGGVIRSAGRCRSNYFVPG